MCAIEKEIEKYLSEIQNNLVGSGKLKKVIMREIEGSVYDYAEGKGIRDISEVYNHFGTPEEMSRTYLSQVDPEKVRKAVKLKKAIIIGIVVALVMLAAMVIFTIIDSHYAHRGYTVSYLIETGETTVVYDE